MSGTVVVIGSLNVDEVASVDVLPRPGETVTATGYATHPGGKGANQAVAAARAGAPVRMVGAVGADDAADLLRGSMSSDGIDLDLRTADGDTGRALILVQSDGENVITVVPGTNHMLTVEDVTAACANLTADDVVLMQLEIPLELVAHAARLADEAGATVVLNAAPALPSLPLDGVDVLVVNEHECLRVAGRAEDADPLTTAGDLAAEHGLTVVVTLGARGAAHTTGGAPVETPSPAVTAVDTTGAGDSFVGYLAAALLEGSSLGEAVTLAVHAGSSAVTRQGAQPAIPYRDSLTTGA
ncbi:ribokinase [Georgenia sp. Z1491]|uniref:ribokinase n=1 Tax=Georgenia sp. Z1491 TaxID=3416707 RepID=UPI003CE6C7B6